MCHKQCWLRFGETFVWNTFLGHSNWKSIFCFIWGFLSGTVTLLLTFCLCFGQLKKILLKSCYADKQLVLSTVCIGLCHFWWIGHISRTPAVYCAVNLVFVKVFRQLIQMLERSWKAACSMLDRALPAWVVAFQLFVGHSVLCRNIARVSNGTLSHKQLSCAPLNISNSSQLSIPSNRIPMFQGPTWWRLPWLPVDQAQHLGQTDDDALQDLFDVTAHQVHHAWSSCPSEKGWSKEEHC